MKGRPVLITFDSMKQVDLQRSLSDLCLNISPSVPGPCFSLCILHD